MDLIIDTSTQRLLVILIKKIGFDYVENLVSNKHQASLLKDIDSLLQKNNCKIGDIDTFGVIVGPGSFTGVRLAVATVKAFCFVNNSQKIVAINNLDLLNHVCQDKETGDYAIAIKSTSSKYYLSQITSKKRVDYLATNEQILNLPCKIFGYNLEKILTKELTRIDLQIEDYIKFFKLKKKDKDFADFRTLEPVYMALSQAEEELLKKND